MVITLIGYRGSGKTTVGADLAARLRWEFTDSDPEIERRAGKSIARIFSEDGEPHFRFLERSVLADELSKSQLVLAAGGGAILDEANRRAMQAAGPVVWLQSSIATIASRIASDSTTADRRPPLSGADTISEVEIVLAEREPLYADAATITVNTDCGTIAGIVDEIVSLLPIEGDRR